MTWNDLPKEIQEKMLERQFEQTGIRNERIFGQNKEYGKSLGGFNWSDTVEGDLFWRKVLKLDHHELFFEEYPKERITKAQFFEFFEDEDCMNTLDPNDREVIFRNVMLGSSDFTVELLRGVLNNYGVDTIYVDGGELCEKFAQYKRESIKINLDDITRTAECLGIMMSKNAAQFALEDMVNDFNLERGIDEQVIEYYVCQHAEKAIYTKNGLGLIERFDGSKYALVSEKSFSLNYLPDESCNLPASKEEFEATLALYKNFINNI